MKTCVSNTPKLLDFFESSGQGWLDRSILRECHAVGKIGGIGKSSSSGTSGRGTSGGTGMGSGTVFAGMEGLKSGSGLFVGSLCTSNPIAEISIKSKFICLTRSAIVHAHLQANEPSTLGASPMKGQRSLRPTQTKAREAGMKLGNIRHGNHRQLKREVNKPVLLLIAGLGGFWATVAFYLLA